MIDWSGQAKKFNTFIRPQTFPMGVKMVAGADDFPAKTRRPLRDMGFKSTICIAMAMTRKYGWTVGLTREDNMCPVASLFYGWSEAQDEDEGNLFNFLRDMNYGRDDAVIAELLASAKTFRLEKGRFSGIVFSPLELGRIDPDLVMVFCNSAQLMRLVHAATRDTGISLTSTFSGRFGACNEGVLQTLKTREAKVVLPGNGDRVWGMVQDDELIFTFPAGMLDSIVEALEATHQAGVRYPIPVDIRHAPNFPPQLGVTGSEKAV
jgi:uncharacterized protein (DUF169 family)